MSHNRLAALIAGLVATTPALAADYSDTIFFGDSLSDAGTYAPFLPPGTGRFSTNPGPVWSEILADGLGFDGSPVAQGGTNFAAGGARITQLPGVPPSPPTADAPPIRTQVTTYLTLSGGAADPDALYFMWAGANDIFVAAGGAIPPDQIQAYLQTTAAEQAGEIARLAAAGARHIVVLNVPDIGTTPFGLSTGPAGSAGLTQLSSGYNTLLFLSIGTTGVPVLGLDTFALLREISASPSTYGFANATVPACGAVPSLLCTAANLVAPGADASFVFADGVHPTSGAHAVIAQFVQSALAAPGLVAQLPDVAVRRQSESTAQHLRRASLDAGGGNSASWWAGVDGFDLDDGVNDGQSYGVTLGVDRAFAEATRLGLSLGYSRTKPDWGAAGGFEMSDFALTGYGIHRWGAFSVAGAVTLARTSFDVDRDVQLGTALRRMSGKPDGSRFAIGVELAQDFGGATLRHGPIAGFLFQRQTVEGYTETSPGGTSTVLTFAGQQRSSTTAHAGYRVERRGGGWRPFGQIAAYFDVSGKERHITVSNSVGALPVRMAVEGRGRKWGRAEFGVQGSLSGGLQLGASLSALLGDDDLQQFGAGFEVRFGR